MAQNDGGNSNHSTAMFTPDQRKRLLKMLEVHERAAGFWLVSSTLMKWVGVGLAAGVAFKVLFGDALKRLF